MSCRTKFFLSENSIDPSFHELWVYMDQVCISNNLNRAVPDTVVKAHQNWSVKFDRKMSEEIRKF